MKRALLAALAVAASLLPAAPRAAPAAPAAGVPLRLQVARAIFTRERWQQYLADHSAELTRRIAEAGEGQFRLAPEFGERLREECERAAPYDELVATQAGVLASHYSAAELRQLLAFYRSPVGKKSARFVHDMVSESFQQVQVRLSDQLPGALERLRPLVHHLPESAPPAGEAPAEGGAPPAPEADAPAEAPATPAPSPQ